MDFKVGTRMLIWWEGLSGRLVEATSVDGVKFQYPPLIKAWLEHCCFGAPALLNAGHEES